MASKKVKKASHAEIAKDLLELSGGRENISKIYACMTRVRIVFVDESKAQLDKMKEHGSVRGYVKSSDEHQFVLGAGTSRKVLDAMEDQEKGLGTDSAPSLGDAKDNKAAMDAKYGNPVGKFLKRVANIFIPLIPGFIGCGIIIGLNNTLSTYTDFNEIFPNISASLALFGGAIYAVMFVLTGVNTAKEFGGSPTIGAILAAIIMAPGLGNIELLGNSLLPGRGGIFAVLLVAAFGAYVERSLRKRVPDSLDLVISPAITIIVTGFVALLFLQPLGGVIADGVTVTFTYMIETGGFFAGFVMAGLFLPLVMFGIHQGFLPIMAEMLNQTGVNALLPILSMAGAGQVGAVIAVLIKTRSVWLKKVIWSGLPVGFLGIGEPLIYGVTLPLGRPFIAACIGAAFGGGWIAMMQVTVTIPGGISGLLLLSADSQGSFVNHALGLIISYIAGFIAAYFIGFKDPVDEEMPSPGGGSASSLGLAK